MLPTTQDEIDEVTTYFNGQAPDLKITFMQKVYSESVMDHRHDVWDVHTDKDRWWVITHPTNLYSQEQFPNMDLAVTFHVGLCLRIPRTEKQRVNDARVLPFGKVFSQLEEAEAALTQAVDVAGYQSVGMRAREVLLTLIGVAQDLTIWTEDPLKRADFRGWSEIIANKMLGGDSNKERRRVFKSAMEEAWTFANWLTHSKSAVWMDGDLALALIRHAIGVSTSYLIRTIRGVPDQCPDCASPHLEPINGETPSAPGILFEWPHCPECGWEGDPVPVGELDEFEGLITRSGESSDEHGIMAAPFRALKKP